MKRNQVGGAVFAGLLVLTGCGGDDHNSPSEEESVRVQTTEALKVAPDEDYLDSPSGIGRVHKSCAREVPTGAQLDPNGDVFMKGTKIDHIDPCQYPSKPAKALVNDLEAANTAPGINGWVEATNQNASTNAYGFNWFNSLQTTLLVEDYPPLATNDGQEIYIFSSLQASNFASIIQPVLQWGTTSCGGGGKYWSMADFYVFCPTTDPNYPSCKTATGASTAHCVHDTAHAVNRGDHIYTEMIVDAIHPGCSANGKNCNWIMYYDDQTTGATGAMEVRPPDAYTSAQNLVLEVYNVGRCLALPTIGNGVAQDSVIDAVSTQLTQPGPSYTSFTPITFNFTGFVTPGLSPSCGYGVGPGNSADSELYWSPQD